MEEEKKKEEELENREQEEGEGLVEGSTVRRKDVYICSSLAMTRREQE